MNRTYWDLAKKAGFVFWDDDEGNGKVIDWASDYDKEFQLYTDLVIDHIERKYKYNYSTNFMGPINQEWIQENGDYWSAGRIDVHRGDEDYEWSLPLMHTEDYTGFSEWIYSLTTEYLWSLEEITSLFEWETNTKIRWFETPKWKKDNDTV